MAECDDERQQTYVTVDDVRECRAMDEAEVATRRKRVSTDQTLVVVSADEVDACRRLRDLRYDARGRKTDRRVFHDIFLRKFTWRREGINGKIAHFALWPGEWRHDASAAVSRAHEKAVENAGRLIMDGRLRVVQVCDHPGHEDRSFPLELSWARGHKGCVHAFTVSGTGEGITTEVSYRWPVPGTAGQYFVIDYAVLRDGELHVAVEVQKSHANSESKKEAFRTHGIRNVQIDADDINGKCRRRDWVLDREDYVTVRHHPESATITWTCEPCAATVEREAQVARARAEVEAEEQRRRDDQERPWLTDYSHPQAGRVLKGFVRSEPVYKSKSGWTRFHLDESAWHPRLNPNPRSLKIQTNQDAVADRLSNLMDECICLFLDNVKHDERCDEYVTFLEFVKHVRPGRNLFDD